MSIGSFFKALLPFSWSSAASDVGALVKQIDAKAEADIANIRNAAAKAKTVASQSASVSAIKNKLASDVASLQAAIAALTAQANKDIAAVTLPTPPAPLPVSPTGTTGPSTPPAPSA